MTKQKKDESKSVKQQKDEERMKKELETLAAILDKSDSAGKEEKGSPQEKVQDKTPAAKPAQTEKIDILKPAIAKAPEKVAPKVEMPKASSPTSTPASKAPVHKPILKPNILTAPQPIPTQKAVPQEKPEAIPAMPRQPVKEEPVHIRAPAERFTPVGKPCR